MSHRWKPSSSQKKAYAQKMQKMQDDYSFLAAPKAIRTGDELTFVSKNDGKEYTGTVSSEKYHTNGEHGFTIALVDGTTKRVMGRNLYSQLTSYKNNHGADNAETREEHQNIKAQEIAYRNL